LSFGLEDQLECLLNSAESCSFEEELDRLAKEQQERNERALEELTKNADKMKQRSLQNLPTFEVGEMVLVLQGSPKFWGRVM